MKSLKVRILALFSLTAVLTLLFTNMGKFDVSSVSRPDPIFSVSGRTLTAEGLAVRNVNVILKCYTDDGPGQTLVKTTNSFGNYFFENLSASFYCTLNVDSNRYVFDTQYISLMQNVNMDLVARPTELNSYINFHVVTKDPVSGLNVAADITITNEETGEIIQTAQTDAYYGYIQLNAPVRGVPIIITAKNKRYRFAPKLTTIDQDYQGVYLYAEQ